MFNQGCSSGTEGRYESYVLPKPQFNTMGGSSSPCGCSKGHSGSGANTCQLSEADESAFCKPLEQQDICNLIQPCSRPDFVAIANQFLDTVLLSNLPTDMSFFGLNRIYLMDFTTCTMGRLLFSTVEVTVSYYQGELKGLNHLCRSGEDPMYYNKGSCAGFTTTVLFSNLCVLYQGKSRHGSIPSTTIRAITRFPEASLYLDIYRNKLDNFPSLRQFRICKLECAHTKFSGLIIFKKNLALQLECYQNHIVAQIMTSLGCWIFAGLLGSPVVLGAASSPFQDFLELTVDKYLPRELERGDLDPVILPDFVVKSDVKITFVTSTVTANYTRGKLEGLSKIRVESCSNPRTLSSGVQEVECFAALPEITANLKTHANHSLAPTIGAKVSSNVTLIDLMVWLHFQDGVVTLSRMFVRSLGPLRTTFTTSTLKNTILNRYMPEMQIDFDKNFKTIVYKLIYGPFQQALSSSIVRTPYTP